MLLIKELPIAYDSKNAQNKMTAQKCSKIQKQAELDDRKKALDLQEECNE